MDQADFGRRHRRHRLRDRAVVLPSSRSAARGYAPGHRCRTSGVRPRPWPRMTHAERAGYLRAMADMLEARASDYSAIWSRGYERRGNDIGGRGMLPVRPGVRLVDP